MILRFLCSDSKPEWIYVWSCSSFSVTCSNDPLGVSSYRLIRNQSILHLHKILTSYLKTIAIGFQNYLIEAIRNRNFPVQNKTMLNTQSSLLSFFYTRSAVQIIDWFVHDEKKTSEQYRRNDDFRSNATCVSSTSSVQSYTGLLHISRR